jgi:hypothetical protein
VGFSEWDRFETGSCTPASGGSDAPDANVWRLQQRFDLDSAAPFVAFIGAFTGPDRRAEQQNGRSLRRKLRELIVPAIVLYFEFAKESITYSNHNAELWQKTS